MHTRFPLVLIAAALLMLAPAGALAQTVDWSGPYAGATIGGSSVSIDYKEPEDGDSDFDADLGGFAAGVLAGFNRTMNSYVVVGVEIDLGKASGSHEPEEDDEPNNYSAFELGTSTRIRGRVGLPRGRSLFFVALGLAGLGVELDDVDPGFGEESGTHWGWTIGFGLDHVISDRLSLRAEYLHDALGDKTHDISAPAGPFFPSYEAEVGPSANIFRGGIVYGF